MPVRPLGMRLAVAPPVADDDWSSCEILPAKMPAGNLVVPPSFGQLKQRLTLHDGAIVRKRVERLNAQASIAAFQVDVTDCTE